MHLTIGLKQIICFGIFISVVYGNLPKNIYGGKTVSIFKYPHQVSIQYQNYHVCGGVIISNYHILTSASCVSAEPNVVYGNIKILSGTNDLEKANDIIIYWKIYQVAYVIIHEKYKPQINWINDIAILKLSSFIEFSYERNEAVMAEKTANYFNFHITGWGINPTTGIMSRFLQLIYVQTMSPKKCMKKYYGADNLNDFQHCAIPRNPAAKITSGNGGSPVMMGRKVVGIVSFVSMNPQLPAVYIRAHKYDPWIEAMKQKI